jgi:two-component system, NarL family, sensor histidine kinase DesK
VNTAATEDPAPDGPRLDSLIRIGLPPRNFGEARNKLIWILPWLVFLSSPLKDLLSGHHTAGALAAGWLGFAAFTGIYLMVVFRNMGRPLSGTVLAGLLAVLGGLAVVLPLTLGSAWLGLFVYVSVTCGVTLPLRISFQAIALTAVTMLLVGLRAGPRQSWSLVVLVVLIGFAMTGVRQLVHITMELRKARAAVAQLAANEERLRLARDLHDLLGHSLSLITLKSELAGRMLPGRPDEAAQQVADIEQVSRQALIDVREAVSGYRRPRLGAELAGSQLALTTAGIVHEVPAEPDLTGVTGEAEAALAWALREAVTNVVRHSDAARCEITVEGADEHVRLRVTDNGSGEAADRPAQGIGGTGLTGLTERLAAAGGSLSAGRSPQGGFTVTAELPVGSDELTAVAVTAPAAG